MAKESSSGKVHYLKNMGGMPAPSPAPAVSPAFEDLVRRLEERIDRVEREFRKTVQSLGHSELSSLIRNLEDKVQKVSEGRHSRKAFEEGLDRFRHLISLQGFQKSLRTFWFGHQEENYDFDEFGLDPAFVKKFKPLFDFLYYNYWRVTAKGLHNIPGEGRGLIVANHAGTFPYDGTMIALGIQNDHPSRRDVRFLVEDFVYHFPFLGTFMYRVGGVRACPENAERLLMKDHLVAVFPEGVKGVGKLYKNRYRLQRFGRGGFIKLALRTGSPIIPVAVIGSEEIHPLLYKSTILARPLGIPYIPVTPTLPWLGLLGMVPLPSKWTIVYGEPIVFGPKYGPKNAEDQLLVNRLSEMVRGKIQEMVVEELKLRRSVWFG